MARLSAEDRDKRLQFAVDAVARGLGPAQSRKAVAKEFDISDRQAREWVKKAIAQIGKDCSGREQKQAYGVAVEMLHVQLAGFQLDLQEMTKELRRLTQSQDLRLRYFSMLAAEEDEAGKQALMKRIEQLPKVFPGAIQSAIANRAAIRTRFLRGLQLYAELHGLKDYVQPVESAINALADAGLFPPDVAAALLEIMEETDRKVQTLDLSSVGGETTDDVFTN